MNSDRIADIGAGSSVAIPVGFTVAQLNEYLQAGAFIVAMISGLCAAYYYWKKSRK